jgi:hypothetical protein
VRCAAATPAWSSKRIGGVLKILRSAAPVDPDVWLLLVGERGWTLEQWEQWLADTICAQLLRPAAG